MLQWRMWHTCIPKLETARKNQNYHRGLLHFLATDPRVPEKVRKGMARCGLPKNEFPDIGDWPHQFYICESLCMVSDLVPTQHRTFGRKDQHHHQPRRPGRSAMELGRAERFSTARILVRYEVRRLPHSADKTLIHIGVDAACPDQFRMNAAFHDAAMF